jgi:uncharacterized protein YegP (UPF0339 family)/predicted nucleotidyltransferase
MPYACSNRQSYDCFVKKSAKEMQMAAKFEIFLDRKQQYRFHFKATNGEIIAASGAYETKASCVKGIKSIQKSVPTALVVDPEETAKKTAKAALATKMPNDLAQLTDSYQFLDAISINNKMPFEELLEVMKDSILESVGKSYIKSIYLFGSHAYGKPSKYSDIDLCVVISDKINRSKEYFAIAKGLNDKKIVSLDILVYNERDFNSRKNSTGIARTIYTKGKVFYRQP